jgi:hypothetical protein
MTRDMKLIRLIITHLQACEDGWSWMAGAQSPFPGYTSKAVEEHLWMLINGDFVDALDVSINGGGRCWLDIRLTWKGHDYAEQLAWEARNPQDI